MRKLSEVSEDSTLPTGSIIHSSTFITNLCEREYVPRQLLRADLSLGVTQLSIVGAKRAGWGWGEGHFWRVSTVGGAEAKRMSA